MKILIDKYIEGIFVNECKNRFLCIVKILGVEEKCYVSSSSHLSHFINLENRKVLLQVNAGKAAKTKYSLFAIETSDGYMLLNLNYVNIVLEKALVQAGAFAQNIKREKKLAGSIKTDIIIEGFEREVYEAKGILSEDIKVYFPSVPVYRVETQLRAFIELLMKGYKVNYCLFLLSKSIVDLKINPGERVVKRLLRRAIKLGMKIKVYRAIWCTDDFIPVREMDVEQSFLEDLLK